MAEMLDKEGNINPILQMRQLKQKGKKQKKKEREFKKKEARLKKKKKKRQGHNEIQKQE